MSAQQASEGALLLHLIFLLAMVMRRYVVSPRSSHSASTGMLMVDLAWVLQMNMDLFNYLLRQRIIFLAGYVNDKVQRL